MTFPKCLYTLACSSIVKLAHHTMVRLNNKLTETRIYDNESLMSVCVCVYRSGRYPSYKTVHFVKC